MKIFGISKLLRIKNGRGIVQIFSILRIKNGREQLPRPPPDFQCLVPIKRVNGYVGVEFIELVS